MVKGVSGGALGGILGGLDLKRIEWGDELGAECWLDVRELDPDGFVIKALEVERQTG